MRFQVDINRLPREYKGKESLVSVTQNGFRVINTWNVEEKSRMDMWTLALIYIAICNLDRAKIAIFK